jgi:hypothetical protein
MVAEHECDTLQQIRTQEVDNKSNVLVVSNECFVVSAPCQESVDDEEQHADGRGS